MSEARPTLIIKILKVNSDKNKDLMTDLNNVLSDVIRAGLMFDIQFAKSDGKTRYPRLIYNNQVAGIGVSSIMQYISDLLNQQMQKTAADPIEDEFNPESILYESDEDSGDEERPFSQEDMDSKMSDYMKKRAKYGMPEISGADEYEDEAPPPKKSSKKSKKHAIHSKLPPKKKKSHGKPPPKVLEQSSGEMGDVFRTQKFKDADEANDAKLLQSMFANTQTSDGI